VSTITTKAFAIQGLLELKPTIFKDPRGFFFESYNEKTFKEAGLDCHFVQDNQSFSHPGVVRGLHFQRKPYAQAKLVRVLKGKILDVAVDLRKSSPTFGQHVCVELNSEEQNMLFIPEGFAHGFHALEESVVLYKCNNFYNKASESGLLWNDPALGIDWKTNNANVSDKDIILPTLEELIKTGDLFE
jgi:dTDP-4-dehydrorhamnose 3,5-epimerase